MKRFSSTWTVAHLVESAGPYQLSVSEACIPQCDGKECGDNGCGTSCGECAEGSVCEEAGSAAEHRRNACGDPEIIDEPCFLSQ